MVHMGIYVHSTTLYKLNRLLEVLMLKEFPSRNWQMLFFVLPSEAVQNKPHHACTLQSLRYWKPAIGLLPCGEGWCFLMIINRGSFCSSFGTVSSPSSDLLNLPWMSTPQLINVAPEMPKINSKTKLSFAHLGHPNSTL